MNDQADEPVRQLAHELQRLGLATPALILVDLASPFSFVGEQILFALAPLLPFRAWHEAAHELLRTLRDDERRDLLQRLLRE